MHEVRKTHINSLHTNIATVVREITKASLRIVSPSHMHRWSSTSAGIDIDFELGTIPDQRPNVLHEMIDRDLGGRTFAFRLLEQPEEEPTLWAGWYEQWKSAGEGTFNLVGMSWTFYWGVFYRPRKAILRAEWDSLHYRSERAAQPHWHIDPSLLVDSYRRIPAGTHAPMPPPAAAGTDLVELPAEELGLREIPGPTGIQELSLKRMHLAMGGWEASDTHPSCWRYAVPANWNGIIKWVERTLVYAREQFMEEFHHEHPIE